MILSIILYITLYYIILYKILYQIIFYIYIYNAAIFPFYHTISPSVACRKISPKTALGVARDLGEFMGRSMGNSDGKPIAMV